MKIEKMVNGLIIMGMDIKRWKKSTRMGLISKKTWNENGSLNH